MIPGGNNLKQIELIAQPSLCHRMLLENHRIIGTCDGIEAVKQAIYNILNTERYQYIIYSWDYGVELEDLYGMPADYAMPELKRRITEALMQDGRIEAVDQFEFEKKGSRMIVGFIVHTVFGRVRSRKEVELNV